MADAEELWLVKTRISFIDTFTSLGLDVFLVVLTLDIVIVWVVNLI